MSRCVLSESFRKGAVFGLRDAGFFGGCDFQRLMILLKCQCLGRAQIFNKESIFNVSVFSLRANVREVKRIIQFS